MPIEPKVINPALAFNFLIEVAGIEAAFVEKVQRPKDATEVVEHTQGGANFTIKTAGGAVPYEDVVLEMVVPADSPESFAYDWLQRAQNVTTGVIGVPDEYKEILSVHRLDGSGNVVESYHYEGAWVREISYSQDDSTDRKAKHIQTVTISVDRRINL